MIKLYRMETRHSDNSVAYMEGLTLEDVLTAVGTIGNFDGPVVTIVEMEEQL